MKHFYTLFCYVDDYFKALWEYRSILRTYKSKTYNLYDVILVNSDIRRQEKKYAIDVMCKMFDINIKLLFAVYKSIVRHENKMIDDLNDVYYEFELKEKYFESIYRCIKNEERG